MTSDATSKCGIIFALIVALVVFVYWGKRAGTEKRRKLAYAQALVRAQQVALAQQQDQSRRTSELRYMDNPIGLPSHRDQDYPMYELSQLPSQRRSGYEPVAQNELTPAVVSPISGGAGTWGLEYRE